MYILQFNVQMGNNPLVVLLGFSYFNVTRMLMNKGSFNL